MKFSPPPSPHSAFSLALPCSDEKTGIHVNKDSVSGMNKLGTNATKTRRSFTHTALRKLSIGPTRWLFRKLVLLIAFGAASVLALLTTVTSARDGVKVRFFAALVLVITLDVVFSVLLGSKAENFSSAFSLMKNRARSHHRVRASESTP